jgi:adenylate kinase
MHDGDKIQILIASSDVIIFNILDQLEPTSDALRTLSKDFDGKKVFIGISSVFTWGKTSKVIGSEEGATATPFEEADFLKRKPLAKYIPYKTMEAQIVSSSTANLKTFVVAAGILYGEGEQYLEKLFSSAWLCEKDSLVIPSMSNNSGTNKLPMIHVTDLARLVGALAKAPPEDASPYVLAVDKSSPSLKEVVTAIAENLSNGKVRDPTVEEVDDLMLDDNAAALQVDLSFNAESSTSSKLDFEWLAQSGCIENMATITTQYITNRNLKPVRCVIMGPPASGKTHFASHVAAAYFLPNLKIKDLIDEVTSSDPELKAEVTKSIEESKEKRMPAKLIAKIVRKALKAPERRNKGW